MDKNPDRPPLRVVFKYLFLQLPGQVAINIPLKNSRTNESNQANSITASRINRPIGIP
jgi:hypothetical protein